MTDLTPDQAARAAIGRQKAKLLNHGASLLGIVGVPLTDDAVTRIAEITVPDYVYEVRDYADRCGLAARFDETVTADPSLRTLDGVDTLFVLVTSWISAFGYKTISEEEAYVDALIDEDLRESLARPVEWNRKVAKDAGLSVPAAVGRPAGTETQSGCAGVLVVVLAVGAVVGERLTAVLG